MLIGAENKIRGRSLIPSPFCLISELVALAGSRAVSTGARPAARSAALGSMTSHADFQLPRSRHVGHWNSAAQMPKLANVSIRNGFEADFRIGPDKAGFPPAIFHVASRAHPRQCTHGSRRANAQTDLGEASTAGPLGRRISPLEAGLNSDSIIDC